jgi:hypothetical protein
MSLAMADSYTAGFKICYAYDFWRPVTAIREGDTDGNDATVSDPNWNSQQNTPSVSDYPSTMSLISGAAAATLAGRPRHQPGALLGHQWAAVSGYYAFVHELRAGGAGGCGLPGLRRDPLPHGLRGWAGPRAQDWRADGGALSSAGEKVTDGHPPHAWLHGRRGAAGGTGLVAPTACRRGVDHGSPWYFDIIAG